MPTNPCSLGAWRELPVGPPARAAWEQFQSFFEQEGYKLFVPDPTGSLPVDTFVPPADCSAVRSEDGYNHFLPECLDVPPKPSRFRQDTGIHFPARSPSNTDVVIRILAIGDDGKEHLAIMRALAAPDAQVPANRTVPMVAELQKDDVVFGIFPVMWSDGMDIPWFKTVREVLDALEQAMEGISYLHQQLIAHRDFALTEVFTNYGYDLRGRPTLCTRTPRLFRSVCPDLRYMINDFELSVQFTPESDPKTRVVTGVPIARYGGTAEEYCKPLAPEARLDTPYCPFRADIYQFGICALGYFRNVNNVAGLRELFVAMGSDDPAARPTASQALSTLRAIRQTASEDVLNDIPVDSTRNFRPQLPGETCECFVCKEVLITYDLYQSFLLSQAKLTAASGK